MLAQLQPSQAPRRKRVIRHWGGHDQRPTQHDSIFGTRSHQFERSRAKSGRVSRPTSAPIRSSSPQSSPFTGGRRAKRATRILDAILYYADTGDKLQRQREEGLESLFKERRQTGLFGAHPATTAFVEWHRVRRISGGYFGDKPIPWGVFRRGPLHAVRDAAFPPR